MAKQTGKEYWTDSMGDKVHKRHITKYDRAQERGVGNIVNRRLKLAEFSERYAAADVDDIKMMLKARGEEGISVAKKGNMTFTSVDGHWRVKIKVRYYTTLDDLAIKARDMMYDYVEPATTEIKDPGIVEIVKAMIDDAFRVDSAGCINQTKARKLLHYHIKTTKWLEARELLIQSMKSQRGKSYVIAEIRDNHQQDHKPIITDITSFWPLDDLQKKEASK
ncbi:MAG: DUF3164 family protein [Kiritimatiellae bacterium]|jgi:hypothetical protein|nr:DUF3164 family protein [Kiritimatiellia bacterium]